MSENFFTPRFRQNLDCLNRFHKSPQYQISQQSPSWCTRTDGRKWQMYQSPFLRLIRTRPTFRPKYLQNFAPIPLPKCRLSLSLSHFSLLLFPTYHIPLHITQFSPSIILPCTKMSPVSTQNFHRITIFYPSHYNRSGNNCYQPCTSPSPGKTSPLPQHIETNLCLDEDGATL